MAVRDAVQPGFAGHQQRAVLVLHQRQHLASRQPRQTAGVVQAEPVQSHQAPTGGEPQRAVAATPQHRYRQRARRLATHALPGTLVIADDAILIGDKDGAKDLAPTILAFEGMAGGNAAKRVGWGSRVYPRREAF